jgi:hypothetical protein
VAKWGVKPGVYTVSVKAHTASIAKSQMCGKPANSTGWRDLGLIHTALFEGMVALSGKPIYYLFGDSLTETYSEEIEFFVPASRGMALNHRYEEADYNTLFEVHDPHFLSSTLRMLSYHCILFLFRPWFPPSHHSYLYHSPYH